MTNALKPDSDRYFEACDVIWGPTPALEDVIDYSVDSFPAIRAELADFLFDKPTFSPDQLVDWLKLEDHEIVIGRLWLVLAKNFPERARDVVPTRSKGYNNYLKCWLLASSCYLNQEVTSNLNKLGQLVLSKDESVASTALVLLGKIGRDAQVREPIVEYLQFLAVGLRGRAGSLQDSLEMAIEEARLGIRNPSGPEQPNFDS